MNYIEDFNQYVKRITDRNNELSQQLSRVDSEQDDILHFLELATYDAVTMMRVTKRLKEVRERRREIKNEIAIIQKICCRIGVANLKNNVQDTYTFKTNILYDISKQKKIITK